MNVRQTSKYYFIGVAGVGPGRSVVTCGKCSWYRYIRFPNALGRTSKAFAVGVHHAKDKHKEALNA